MIFSVTVLVTVFPVFVCSVTGFASSLVITFATHGLSVSSEEVVFLESEIILLNAAVVRLAPQMALRLSVDTFFPRVALTIFFPKLLT